METTETTTAPAERFEYIPLEQLTPSPFQPKSRKADDDLVASVAQHGVVTPGLARPTPAGPTPYEIVFGHCRWDASRKAKRPAMPFIVRELGDSEALELLLVENLRRRDLHPLDEAEGYERLYGEHRYTVEQIAARVGRSKGYVYARMKLLALQKPGRLAFREGKLEASVALYLARVPAALQDKALKVLLDYAREERIPARDASYLLQRQFMLELKEAPFAIADSFLVPEAGACTSCLKRTGNQRELFEDVERADVCTDPTCYESKVEALWQIRSTEAKEKGAEVLTEKAAKEVWPSEWGPPQGYVDLDSFCHRVDGGKKWKQVLGKGAPVVLARHPKDGRIVELVETSAASKILKDKGLVGKNDREPAAVGSKKTKADAAAEKAARELRERIAAEAMAGFADAAEKGFSVAAWRLLLEECLGAHWSATVYVGKRRGYENEKGLEKAAAKMNATQLQGLVAELLMFGVVEPFVDDIGNGEMQDACKAFGVDFKAIEKRLAAAAVAAAPAEEKKPAKKGKRS